MKVFIPCEDHFLEQICPHDRLVPWQACWNEYLQRPEKDPSDIENGRRTNFDAAGGSHCIEGVVSVGAER